MAKSSKFGTFGGVFVPSILTILGVIMYLRLPMIIGEAGLWSTIGIIVVAHIISVTTGLSVSSIATDKKVEAGGTYYMISRSLGLPIGGTLGLALFVGLSFSVSLYLIGFSESFLSYWGFSTDISNIRLTGSIILLAVTTLTFISTSLAIKTQYFIMAAILLSLVSILFGNHEYTPTVPALTDVPTAIPLMVLFGIFFPAVTGFEAGVSMSGDLKDPKKSIPTGSIMAIAVGFVVYIGLSFFFANTVDSGILRSDSQVLLKISWIPELVIAGIWGATLSSALGSILGAPRILQATAIDKITPRFFGKGYGPTNEPRNALLLTFFIAEAGILIGELDVIARVVSIFFITTYGFLNMSAAFERWTSADFRPDFKIPGWVSLLGAFACIVVMIQLDFVAMLGAVVILGLIYLLLKRRELTLDSGDAWSGVWASLVKSGLTNLMGDKLHKRNWRPNIIMFSGNPTTRTHMVEIGKSIAGKLGILSAFELVKSDSKILTKKESNLEKGKDSMGYFSHKLHCKEIYEGMDQIARVYGFSGVEPNTILMGWSRQPTNHDRFIQLLESFSSQNFNTLFLNYDHTRGYGAYKTIDIWWSGHGRNLALAFNLVRHLTNALSWRHAEIRILIVNQDNSQSEDIYKKMITIVEGYRVKAAVKIVSNELNERLTKVIIQSESADTDLVILGVPDKHFNQLDKYYDQINEIVGTLGSSMVINASSDFESLEVFTGQKGSVAGETLSDELVELDQLPPFRSSEITQDLRKVDENGQKVIDLFYYKTIHKISGDHLEVIQSLRERVNRISHSLSEISTTPELLKRKKAIDTLKSDTLFKLKTLITKELSDQQLHKHQEHLREGITWYLGRLHEDFRKYPSRLRVWHDRSDFTINQADTSSLKTFKRWKKLKHAFGTKPIPVTINYRAVSRYYQFQTRLIFLQKLLDRYQLAEEMFYKNLRKSGGDIVSILDEVERSIWNELEWSVDEMLAGVLHDLSGEQQDLAHVATQFHNRLKVEYRLNLQAMGRDMEQLQVAKRINRSRRSKKYYDEKIEAITEFSENYFQTMRTLLNMVSMELVVDSTHNRMEVIFEAFHAQLAQAVKNNYLKKLEQVAEKLNNSEKTSFDKINLELDFDTELFDAHEQHLAKIVKLAEEMPESVEVYALNPATSDVPETVSIPVTRMAEYYIESRYETLAEEAFDLLIESLKRSVFTAQDAVSLAQFNQENAIKTGEMTQQEVYDTCKEKLEKEKQQVESALDQFRDKSGGFLDHAFEPLEPVNIQESAERFNTGLRTYQGQQVLTGAGNLFGKLSVATQQLITKIWYGRSETILLSRKLDKDMQLVPVNSKLLDLREKLSPNDQVIRSLPQYYVSLFSGKSNIGKDFWIKRPEEESLFKKAVRRYKSGFGGGLMILGDRNTGKTAFAKHMTQTAFKGKNVYAVFPPISGTSSLDVFNDSLAKALQKRGDAAQMISQLPADSVVIVNDLELFWERSADGLAVVQQLEALIDEFGQRVLFIVNMNPHAYKLINQISHLSDRFIEVITLKSFNAEALKELILKRHKSSGLAFGYRENTGQLNELQTAGLFNLYFNYSNGVPGTALNGWLANICNANKGFVEVSKPEYPSLEAFRHIDKEWVMLLNQFILHKRLTEDKIQRINAWDQRKTRAVLLALTRAGLVVEKSTGVYHLDTFIQPFVIDVLKKKEIL